MKDEDQLHKMYRDIERIVEGADPMVIAGIFMAQAMKIYKTCLAEEDFKQVTEYILNTKDNIEIEPKGRLH